MIKLDMTSILSAVTDIEKMVNDSKTFGSETYEFHSFKARNDEFKLAAIDGSNNTIKGVNFLVAALRVGYQIFQKGEMTESNISPITLELIANNSDPSVGFANKFERFYQEITGDLPVKYPDFDKTPERIRTLLEWERVRYLVDTLGKDDIIIFDGAFISGTITTSQEFVNDLMDKAHEKGITLVGLSKDTTLSIGAAPVPLVLLESASQHHPKKNWYVEYKPGIYFVKFSKHKDLVFRCDIVTPEHLTVEDVLARVAGYCFDHATFGYPYPMQAIHDAVRIDEMQRDECLDAIKSLCMKSKIPLSLFENLFSIYHDQLDTISFGR